MLTNSRQLQVFVFLTTPSLFAIPRRIYNTPRHIDLRIKVDSTSSSPPCHTTAMRSGLPVPVASRLGTIRLLQLAPVCLPTIPETRQLLTPSAQAQAPRYRGRKPLHSGTSSRVRFIWIWGSRAVRPSQHDCLPRSQINLLGTQLARHVVTDGWRCAQNLERPKKADWFTEVERAIENLVKSGKMFGAPGGRREFQPPPFPPGPARFFPVIGGEYYLTVLAGSRTGGK